jgi:hypothetical protein
MIPFLRLRCSILVCIEMDLSVLGQFRVSRSVSRWALSDSIRSVALRTLVNEAFAFHSSIVSGTVIVRLAFFS